MENSQKIDGATHTSTMNYETAVALKNVMVSCMYEGFCDAESFTKLGNDMIEAGYPAMGNAVLERVNFYESESVPALMLILRPCVFHFLVSNHQFFIF